MCLQAMESPGGSVVGVSSVVPLDSEQLSPYSMTQPAPGAWIGAWLVSSVEMADGPSVGVLFSTGSVTTA